MSIPLPDLTQYRAELVSKGVRYPLPAVVMSGSGLLAQLPPSPANKTGWPWTDEVLAATYSAQTSWPKITIVTPSYNQHQFLEQTIRSVLLQNYPNLEYIVIDGGSTDGSKAILEKYSPWLSYWQSEKDGGQGQAINIGFSLASGNYYGWINSDDYYAKGAFSKMIDAFLTTTANFVYGYVLDYLVTDSQYRLVKVPPLYDYFLRIPTLAQPACFWNADIHQPIWEELNCSLDYELWLRIVKGQKRSRIKQPLAVVNVHDEAKTYNPKMKSSWEADHELICAPDAHGPVYDWDKRVFLHKLLLRAGRLLHMI